MESYNVCSIICSANGKPWLCGSYEYHTDFNKAIIEVEKRLREQKDIISIWIEKRYDNRDGKSIIYHKCLIDQFGRKVN